MTTLSNDQIKQLNNYSIYMKPMGTTLFHGNNVDSSFLLLSSSLLRLMILSQPLFLCEELECSFLCSFI